MGVITRNRYGAEVLNTDAVLIADIDLPEPVRLPGQGLLGRLFGRSRHQRTTRAALRPRPVP